MRRCAAGILPAILLCLALLLPAAAVGEGFVGEAGEEAFSVQVDPPVAESPEQELPEASEYDKAAAILYAAANDLSDAPVEITLGVKEKHALNMDAVLFGSKVTYKSLNRKVAKVSKKGVVTAKKAGTATVDCYADGVLAVRFVVNVLPAPKKVSLGTKKLTLGVGESVQLTPVISEGSHASFHWSSSKKKVAAVSRSGVVTGRKKGKAKVTVKTQNGKKATVTVVVKKTAAPALMPTQVPTSGSENVPATPSTPAGDEATRCRALLIGQEHLESETCRRNRADVGLMAKMLESVKGPGGADFAVTTAYDLSAGEALNAIQKTFDGAGQGDVSLFFIATHGDITSTGSDAGKLAMSPNGNLTLGELAQALNAVPGRIVVILESCGSGAGIYDEGGNAEMQAFEAAAIADDGAAIEAFLNIDPGISVQWETGDAAGALMSGELLVENKFYVLTASRYQENSYGWEQPFSDSYNFFTRWLTDGIGLSGSMPADADGDGQVTLHELYAYISRVGDDTPLGNNDGNDDGAYYQHVQVYPSNSGFVLFRR